MRRMLGRLVGEGNNGDYRLGSCWGREGEGGRGGRRGIMGIIG